MKSCRFSALLFPLVFSCAVFAADIPLAFDSAAKEQRFHDLIAELRCLVCQNQSLADSNSELAQDLRNEIYQMMQNGKTDQEITGFLVERYGDFVLYRPPINITTLLLWFGPLLFMACAAWIVVRIIRNREGKTGSEISGNSS